MIVHDCVEWRAAWYTTGRRADGSDSMNEVNGSTKKVCFVSILPVHIYANHPQYIAPPLVLQPVYPEPRCQNCHTTPTSTCETPTNSGLVKLVIGARCHSRR